MVNLINILAKSSTKVKNPETFTELLKLNSFMACFAVSIILFVLVIVAEILHFMRIRKLGKLVFGPTGKPYIWVWVVPFLRAIAVAMLSLGFGILLVLNPDTKSEINKTLPEDAYHHIVFMVDSSPSMLAKDSKVKFADKSQPMTVDRRTRARDIVSKLLLDSDLPLERIKLSIFPFWFETKKAIIDSVDPEAVINMINHYYLICFEARDPDKPKKTDLVKCLSETFEYSKRWPNKSTTIFVLSDGETLPDKGLPELPPSVAKVVVIGLGDITKGAPILNGQHSKQDQQNLQALANRLRGRYFNGNIRNIPAEDAKNLIERSLDKQGRSWDLKTLAKIMIVTGAILLFIFPWLLNYFGSAWGFELIFNRKESTND